MKSCFYVMLLLNKRAKGPKEEKKNQTVSFIDQRPTSVQLIRNFSFEKHVGLILLTSPNACFGFVCKGLLKEMFGKHL